jgi:hypothetical protein
MATPLFLASHMSTLHRFNLLSTCWRTLVAQPFRKTLEPFLVFPNELCSSLNRYKPDVIDVVENGIKKSKVGLIQSEKNWCVICINQNLFEMIGDFDEVFYPAYYEDSDYLYRMKLEGIRQDVDATLNPLIFRASQTYEKNPELVNQAMQNFAFDVGSPVISRAVGLIREAERAGGEIEYL